jgi:glycosyltransferase involved in cell wall biosynthesis
MFLGKYDYPPNMYAAEFIVRTVAPIIFARYPNARFVMVGRNPPVRLTVDSRIIWTGEVENAMPYINACDVTLAPIPLASGTRLKVLSYLACDRPVVATPEAVEGLNLRDGKHVLIRNLDNFPEAVLRLLEDRTAAAELAAGASEFTKSNYDWKVTTSKVTEIYRQIS